MAGAVADYDIVLANEPKNASAYYQRAIGREKLAQRDGALADYKLALANDQNMADARKAVARMTAEDLKNKPRVAELEKKVEPAVKTAEMPAPDKVETIKAAPALKEKQEVKPPVAADNPKIATPLPPVRDEKKIAVAATPDVKPSQESKPAQWSRTDSKISRKEPDRKSAERSDKKRQAERHGKHEKEARSRKEREKTAHIEQKRRKIVQDDKPRVIRAGSDESRNLDRRRSDTRFTEIWTERR